MTEEEKAVREYNRSEEANRRRLTYFIKIMKAYDSFDFTDLFDDLADDCQWGGKRGKEEVVRSLKEGAASMKERDYRHVCRLVQVEDAYSPLLFNTSPDGKGKTVRAGLLYGEGEICMIDETALQTLFFRMKLSPEGKILSCYATLPPGRYRVIG